MTIEGVTGNGSQKAKQEILRENFTPSFEYVLKIAFNPFITTKLNKLEVLKESPYIAEFDPYEKFKDLTDRLFKAKAANASLREEAYELVNCIPYSYEERKMLSKVLTKKVNIGIGAKLVNKSIGREVIPDPSLMLATDEQSHIKKWNYIICEEKYDGVKIKG